LLTTSIGILLVTV